MDMTTAEVNMEVSFGHSRFVPFLAGGIGAMRLDPTLDVAGRQRQSVGRHEVRR